MPTIRIFGQEIERKQLLIGGGLIAAAVAVVVWLRARSASAAVSAAPAAQPDQGYGMSVAAPTGQVADQYQQQLQNSELEAQSIANTYQANLVKQQQTAFDFQQRQAEALAPSFLKEQQSELAAQEHYYKTVANTRISCPGGQGVAQSPGGQLYCRQKTSGGILGIPIGDVFRTIQGFVGGVEAAAPSIGYQTAQDAARYYTGKVFTPSAPTAKPKLPKTTPPIAPTTHGYGELFV